MEKFRKHLTALLIASALAITINNTVNASEELDAKIALLTDAEGLAKAKVSAEIALSLRQANAEQALHYAHVSLAQLKATPHPATRVNVINTLAVAYLQKREYDTSEKYAEQALALAVRFDFALEQARALNTLGGLAWFRSDLDGAKTLFEESMHLRKKHQAFDELAPALNNLGLIEEIQGRYRSAIEFYLQAIHFAEKVGNKEQLARPLGNLGILNQMLKNFDKALHFYERTLQLKLEVGNRVGAAVAHNNISEIHIEREDFKRAIASLEAGLELLSSVDASQEKALLLLNSGSAYLHLKHPDKAFEFFDRTQALISRFNSKEIDIYLAQGYAQAYLQKGQLEQALVKAQESLILAEAKQHRNSVKKAYYLLYEIYKEKGLEANALAAHENFFRIQKELANKENREYAERLQAEFENEKKEKELALLQSKNALQEIDIKRQEFIRNLSVVLSLSIILLGFFIHRMRTIKVKTSLLEKKVIERTYEIQQKNSAIADLLEQKEGLLARKNTMFSAVSHEFRTPLTLILGPLKKMIDTTGHKGTRATLTGVYRNGTRLLRMVDQLLDLARLDMHACQPSESVDVAASVNYLTLNMQSLFEEHNIAIKVNCDTNTWIDIAPDALEKSIVNLLSNAIKYTPDGGEVAVKVCADNEVITISVRDTGIGIAKEQHQKIFERFTRLENDLPKPVPGAGIGLALVKELVESYGGKIDLISEAHQGSEFTITFPRSHHKPKKTLRRTASTTTENEVVVLKSSKNTQEEKTKKDTSPQKNTTILIVEDNEEMRSFIGTQLDEYYHCLFAEDGRQGISIAIREIPDLIISDLMMPNTGGLELAATLKSEQLTSHIPIVILTAKGDPETRHAAWRKNVDEYIEKPFDTDELLLRCENILSIRQLLAQGIRPEDKQECQDDNGFICFNERDRVFLEKLHQYMEQSYYENQLNAKTISKSLAITEKQLQRKVKALTNTTIPAFVRNFRLKKGADMLAKGASITSVAFDVGFASQSYFSTAFATRYGCSPSDYQQQQRKVIEKNFSKRKAGVNAG